MERLLSRAVRAKAQAERHLKKVEAEAKKRALNQSRKEHAAYLRMVNADRRQSRFEEKEDHRLGPLAPRRAVGKDEVERLGAFDQHRIIPPAVPDEYRIKYWNIVEKDRVVILRGPDRHKIGVVKSIDKENNTLTVEGMNMVPMIIPDAFRSTGPNAPSVIHREAPTHYKDVRLVVPLLDPETNTLKDAVVANIAMSKVFHDRWQDEDKWTRYIAGTETEIPWPEKQEKEYFDHPGDTRILDVETATYKPHLLSRPFPGPVIDELRCKYSKFRTRHDPGFVRLVEKKAEKKAEKQARLRILTPVQELNKDIRAEKKARGPPVLTPEVMEQIGRVMAQNRPELLQRVQSAELD